MLERVRAVVHGPNHRWWAFGTVALGTFMSTLDSSIVNVSLPTIMSDFRTGLATIQWVVLAYLLTITSLLLTFGRLADIWGRKRVYTIGFAIFTVGALSSGFSASPLQLILSRVVQAVGSAMIQANGLAITNAVFPGKDRGRALGINGTIVASGSTLGPTIGGVLVSAFGWHAIFRLTVPVALVAMAMAIVVLDERRISFRRAGASSRFDPAGALLAALTLSSLLFGLNRGGVLGWSSRPIVALLAVASIGFVVFILVERRVVAPLLDLRLFRQRAFATGSLAALCSFLAMSTNVFLMPFYLQLVLGHSPAKSGLLLTPTTLALAVVSPVAGWLSERVGARILSSLGLAITATALVLLSRLPVDASTPAVVWHLALLGLGTGTFNSPNTGEVFSSVPRERYGVAGGFLSMVRNSGQVIGSAIAGAILVGAIAPVVGNGGLDALRVGIGGGGDRSALLESFMAGLRTAYLFAAAIAATGAVVSLLRGRRAVVAATKPAGGDEAAAPGGRAAD